MSVTDWLVGISLASNVIVLVAMHIQGKRIDTAIRRIDSLDRCATLFADADRLAGESLIALAKLFEELRKDLDHARNRITSVELRR